MLAAVGRPRPGIARGHVTATGGIEVADSLVTNKRPKDLRSRLFENRDGAFVDVTDRAGVGTGGYGRDAVFADLDNDGDLDLYVVTGGIRGRNPPDVLYRNDGDGTFTDVTAESGAAGPREGTGDAVVAFDYDRDGRLDLFTINGHGPPPHGRGPYWLGQNRSEAGRFVELELTGRRSQPDGARRARARAARETDPPRRALRLHRGRSRRACSRCTSGSGRRRRSTSRCLWPSGATSRRTGRAGERLEAVEPAGEAGA